MPGKKRPLRERLYSKIKEDPDTGCLEWTGATDHKGYGRIQRGGRAGGTARPHVIAWELEHGPVPEGLELDHLCDNPPCVNPDHLEPVTHRENMLRGKTNACAQHARKTHCVNGHPLSGDNLVPRPDGSRGCGECRRQWLREHYWRQKAGA